MPSAAFPDFGLGDSRAKRVNTLRARKRVSGYRIGSDLESSSSEMSSSGPSSGLPIYSSGVGAAVYVKEQIPRSHAGDRGDLSCRAHGTNVI